MESNTTYYDLHGYVMYCFKNKLPYDKKELTPLVEKELKNGSSKNVDFLTEVFVTSNAKVYNEPIFSKHDKTKKKMVDMCVNELIKKRDEQIKRDAKIYKKRTK